MPTDAASHAGHGTAHAQLPRPTATGPLEAYAEAAMPESEMAHGGAVWPHVAMQANWTSVWREPRSYVTSAS